MVIYSLSQFQSTVASWIWNYEVNYYTIYRREFQSTVASIGNDLPSPQQFQSTVASPESFDLPFQSTVATFSTVFQSTVAIAFGIYRSYCFFNLPSLLFSNLPSHFQFQSTVASFQSTVASRLCSIYRCKFSIYRRFEIISNTVKIFQPTVASRLFSIYRRKCSI